MNSFQEIFTVFPAAAAAAALIAAACSFVGTLVVLKRLVFIGAALSETAACGIAAGFFFHFNPQFGAFLLTLLAVTGLAFTSEERNVSRDSVLAVIFILCASLGIVFVSKSPVGLHEVKSLLYGDVLVTSAHDLRVLGLTVIPPALLILIFIRPIFYTFSDRDEAKVLGIRVRLWELLFYYALGTVVSACSKLGGMLLVFCCLTVPPMAGLFLSRRMPGVVLISVFCAVVAALSGFWISYSYDLPVNPVIALTACCLSGAAFLAGILRRKYRRSFQNIR